MINQLSHHSEKTTLHEKGFGCPISTFCLNFPRGSISNFHVSKPVAARRQRRITWGPLKLKVELLAICLGKFDHDLTTTEPHRWWLVRESSPDGLNSGSEIFLFTQSCIWKPSDKICETLNQTRPEIRANSKSSLNTELNDLHQINHKPIPSKPYKKSPEEWPENKAWANPK